MPDDGALPAALGGDSLSTVRYYQILLEAFARAEAEAALLRPAPLISTWSGARPIAHVLSNWLPGASDKRGVVQHIARQLRSAEGVVLEFGVFEGASVRRLARILPGVPIYGFDSFEGFPQDGRADWSGDFSVPRLPKAPSSVTLVPGYFEETLPGFVARELRDAKIRLLHIDCDIYSSTRTVLEHLAPWMRPGQVIVFDELLHYHRFPENEALALVEMLERHDLAFEWLALRGRLMPLEEFCERRAAGPMFGPFPAWRRRGYYQDAAIRLTARPAGYENRLAALRPEAERLAGLCPLRLGRRHG